MTGYELQYRDNLQPEGKWRYFRYYTESEKEDAIAYRDGANTNHPGRWQILPVRTEEVEVVTCSVEEQDFYGDPLP